MDVLNNRHLLLSPSVEITSSVAGYNKVSVLEDIYIQEKNNVKKTNIGIYTKEGKAYLYLDYISEQPRFIAQTGEELKTHLNALNDLPKGVTYQGDLVRSLSKKSMDEWGAIPEKMSESYFGSWGRYDLEGEDNVLYFSRNVAENQIELIPHYGQWADYNTFVFEKIKVDNLLDLTDDVVRQKLGTEFDKLTKVLESKEEMYEFTNVIAYWARQKGYNGIIAPGARGAKD